MSCVTVATSASKRSVRAAKSALKVASASFCAAVSFLLPSVGLPASIAARSVCSITSTSAR